MPDLAEDTRSRVGWGLALVLLVAATIWAFAWPASEQTQGVAGVRADPRDVYNPVVAGEPLPDGFRQLLPRDAILPVYDPEFASVARTTWPDDTDVIGVSLDGEAKAYPVSFLGGRELVVDEIAGEPILVSW